MAEPDAIVNSFQDQAFNHHLHVFENFLMRDDDESPSVPQQNSFNPINPNEIVHLVNNTSPLVDPFVLDNNVFKEDLQTDPCRIWDETRSGDISNGFGNPIRILAWPVQAPPYTCSCCQVLREITHTNGADILRLEVHGRLGVICHAVLEKYSVDLTTNESHEYKMFDFCKESISGVKQFLEKYCKDQKTSGFIMLQDPLSLFYEAVCVGFDWEFNLDTDDNIPLNFPGENQINHQPDAESNRATLNNKSTLSMQRERTGKLTMRDFVNYFHIPIEVAAKKIQVCATVMKKICRKHGLSRWPYRKIKSIERKISMKAKCLTSLDAEERARGQADIQKLKEEIANIYTRFKC